MEQRPQLALTIFATYFFHVGFAANRMSCDAATVVDKAIFHSNQDNPELSDEDLLPFCKTYINDQIFNLINV